MVPIPSWPFWLRPKANRSPLSVTASVCVSPQAIFTMLWPLRAEIDCGMKTSLQSPCPSRPKSPLQVWQRAWCQRASSFQHCRAMCSNHIPEEDVLLKAYRPLIALLLY